MTMLTLLIMVSVGLTTGALGGALSAGGHGLIVGGSIGLVLGSATWAVLAMIAQARRERRLDRYFQHNIDGWE